MSRDQIAPGDLLFYYNPISHVGMYVGGGMMINAPRSGDLVCIEDAYRSSYVTARRMVVSTPPPSYTKYEQGDTHLAYAGSWSTGNTTSASGGSFAYANSANASVTIAFEGTYLGLIAKKSPVYGIAKVSVDGKTPVLLDLYSSAEAYQQKVWNTGTLASGAHTVTVFWSGTKNASATGTNIGIDAVEIAGSLAQATAPSTPPPGTVRYEQTDTHIAWSGTWTPFSTTGPSAGDYARSCTSGSYATIAFNGTYLAWIATKGTTLSKAQVSLDGGTPKTIDLAATTVAYQQKVWDTGTLPSGSHTVRITWDASNAAGKYISVDAVDVNGTLTTASSGAIPPPLPTTTRYEQKDTRFAFGGGWIAANADLATATSFRYASSAAYATVTFTGTYLVWIAKKSPEYGTAKVTVDGGTPVTVDLYSATAVWKQPVWNTGVLASGSHTVKIEWSGAKNAAATEDNINVDAFDIAGTVTQAPAPAPTRYEQIDTHFIYAGIWTATSSTSASGGSFRYANTTGSSVTITFTGTSLAWIAKKSSVYGKAKVTLDGGTPVIVDLYASSPLFQKTVWSTGTLTPWVHTVKIEWTGTKNSSSTGTNISVDAFDIVGTLNE